MIDGVNPDYPMVVNNSNNDGEIEFAKYLNINKSPYLNPDV